MSSICWTGYGTGSSTATDLRRRAYLITFFFLLWGVNVTIVVLGLPLIIFAKLKPKRSSARAKTAPPRPADLKPGFN